MDSPEKQRVIELADLYAEKLIELLADHLEADSLFVCTEDNVIKLFNSLLQLHVDQVKELLKLNI